MAGERNSVNLKNNEEITSLENQLVESSWLENTLSFTHKSYHEMADTPVKEKDVLTQLNENLDTLADLQKRYSFVMKEVRYLLKV